jgi:diacylglycerol kinase (ATP)
MRAAAILGLGCSRKNLAPFQAGSGGVEWQTGMPATSADADVVLLFGGDGTIHRHLGQLVRLGLPVLVVPAGSGNDFARALGLHGVKDSLAAWRGFCGDQGKVWSVDLGVISAAENAGEAPSTLAQGRSGPHYFCCVAGVGLDAEVSRRANQLPRWLRGHGGYALSLASTIFQFTPMPVRVLASENPETSGHDWKVRSDQPTILAAFANTPVYGGGMRIAPQARMDDGELDVCVIGAVNPFKLASMFPTVYFGRHLRIREVEYFKARQLRVETEHPLDIYADGEYVGQTPVEVGVKRAALKVVRL